MQNKFHNFQTLPTLIVSLFITEYNTTCYAAEKTESNVDEILAMKVQSLSTSLVNLPTPYCDLKNILPFNAHGWYSNRKWIEKLFENNSLKNVLEVGCWVGLSTRHIASLIPEGGQVTAIDTWNGSAEHLKNRPELESILPVLYEQFLSNCIHSKQTHIIKPIRTTSLEASKLLAGSEFDLIYLDASHDFESVYQDLTVWFPFVSNKKGIFCGDDWNWGKDFPVRRAVQHFASENQLTIYIGGTFWFLGEEGQFQEISLEKCEKNIWTRK